MKMAVFWDAAPSSSSETSVTVQHPKGQSFSYFEVVLDSYFTFRLWNVRLFKDIVSTANEAWKTWA
jgi:hypothetical protein